MMGCEYCTPKYRPLFESAHWRVYLDPDQGYLGRCRVILKRHAGTLSMLTSDEWKDFGIIVKKVESVLEHAFGPKMFNWTCMVNNAYLHADPDPHIHWHVRGRYDKPVEIAGVTFDDPEFGHHYDRARKKEISEDVQRAIRERILHYA
jgi:diadenosine tetraphosphate (Ap4A) HIT family hydrolase